MENPKLQPKLKQDMNLELVYIQNEYTLKDPELTSFSGRILQLVMPKSYYILIKTCRTRMRTKKKGLKCTKTYYELITMQNN